MENKEFEVGDILRPSACFPYRKHLKDGFIFKVLRWHRMPEPPKYSGTVMCVGIGEADLGYHWLYDPFECWVGNLVKDQFMTDVYRAQEQIQD